MSSRGNGRSRGDRERGGRNCNDRGDRGEQMSNTQKSTLPNGMVLPGAAHRAVSADDSGKILTNLVNDGGSMRSSTSGGRSRRGGGGSHGSGDTRQERQQYNGNEQRRDDMPIMKATSIGDDDVRERERSYNNSHNNRIDRNNNNKYSAAHDTRNDDAALREEVRMEKNQRRKAAQTQPLLCGVVVALRENFGFLQPWANIRKEEIETKPDFNRKVMQLGEQLYFSERESYRDIQVGDQVFYVLKDTQKGPQAAMLRNININELMPTYTTIPDSAVTQNEALLRTSTIKDTEGNSILGLITVKGIIVKDCEPHRNNLPGLIQVTFCETNKVSSPKNDKEKKKKSEKNNSSDSSFPINLMEVGLVSFTVSDISRFTKRSNTASSQQQGARYDHHNSHQMQLPVSKGDEVTFQYMYAHSPSRDDGSLPFYVRPVLITLSRSLQELRADQLLEEFITKKTRREQGVIDSIRNDNSCGFIKPVDRTELIFFRFDDIRNCSDIVGSTDNSVTDEVVETINGVPISDEPKKNRDHLSGRIYEGLEVEFFFFNSEKSATSDRRDRSNKQVHQAIGITTLMKGTIQFEQTIAKNATATVIVEPRLHPREEPGTLLLDTPVEFDDSDGKKLVLKEIELWSRCAPDGMVFRIGDIIGLDVNHFRPEKLQFARNIRMKSYRKMSRHTGRICSIRDEGYGFIKLTDSVLDDIITKENCYFRLSEVISSKDGSMLPVKQLTLGMPLSFEILLEEARNREVRSRALRVMQLDSFGEVIDDINSENSSMLLVSKGMRGKVTKDSNKKDSPGSIAIMKSNSAAFSPGVELGDAASEESTVKAIRLSQVNVTKAKIFDDLMQFQEISKKSNLTEFLVEQISVAEVRLYFEVLTQEEYTEKGGFFFGIVCEIPSRTASNGHLSTGLQALKVKNIVSREKRQQDNNWEVRYLQWVNDSISMLKESSVAFEEQQARNDARRDETGGRDQRRGGDGTGAPSAIFVRSDTSEIYGQITRDLMVTFDLYVDRNSNQKIAKSVQLTDEPAYGVSDDAKFTGVIESVFSRGIRYGYLRSIPLDEKIFWSSSCIEDKESESKLGEGSFVSFGIRRRGGVRTAVDIELKSIPDAVETIQQGKFLGVVVGSSLSINSQTQDQFIIPLDAANEPTIQGKFWDYNLADSLSQHAHARNKTIKSNRSEWERIDLANVDATEEKDIGGKESKEVKSDNSTETTGAMKGEGTTKHAQVSVVTGAKYYPAMPRTRIPLVVTSESASYNHTSSDGTVVTMPGFEPGTLVYAQAVTNFLISREPLRAINPELASNHSLNAVEVDGVKVSIPKKGRLMKRRGVITKLAVRGRVDHSSDNGSLYDGIELTEIRELPSNVDPAIMLELGQMTNNTGDSVFYCDTREIIIPAGAGKEAVSQGDEVEFYGVVVSLNGNAVNVASYAHLGPRRDKEGIVFKRSINSDLKATLSQQPVQSKPRGVVMARGPAEDGTNGFPNGWRAEHIAKTSPDLPWAHLLPHISFGESATILPSTDNGKIMHSKNR